MKKTAKTTTTITREALEKLYRENWLDLNWFIEGSKGLSDALRMLDAGATNHEVAIMIWATSRSSDWTLEQVEDVLDNGFTPEKAPEARRKARTPIQFSKRTMGTLNKLATAEFGKKYNELTDEQQETIYRFAVDNDKIKC